MTLQELCEKTLRHLGILAASETAETADIELVEEAYDSFVAEFEVSPVIRTATIPYIVDVLAYRLADDFGLDEMKVQRYYTIAEKSKLSFVRTYFGVYDTDQVITAEFY